MQELYSRTHPFIASIKRRYSLCRSNNVKETQHVEIDIAGSGITYNVGDSLAVLPDNDPITVQRILELLKADGDEKVQEKRTGETFSLLNFLTRKANLKDCAKPFIAALAKNNSPLKALLEDGSAEALKKYQEGHEVLDALEECDISHLTPQEFCHLLKPMMPRFYSIASSMSAVGEEVHLTVALKKWEINGSLRMGVCTHYLCNLAPLDEKVIPVYIQAHKGFTIPENRETPMIMVGPGTGIAPFRAFMQEREALNASGKNWLFFGECHRKDHFFYEEYWKSLEQQKKLRLDLAFSRDQKSKVYVQDKILEQGKELFQWIEEGANLYVCGDATRMAKDVEAALLHVIREHGSLAEEEAKEYLKRLRHEKRYLRDVY